MIYRYFTLKKVKKTFGINTNEINNQPISTIYGSITNGSAWRFLQLIDKTVTIDLRDYPLPPVDLILVILVCDLSQTPVWMASYPQYNP